MDFNGLCVKIIGRRVAILCSKSLEMDKLCFYAFDGQCIKILRRRVAFLWPKSIRLTIIYFLGVLMTLGCVIFAANGRNEGWMPQPEQNRSVPLKLL